MSVIDGQKNSRRAKKIPFQLRTGYFWTGIIEVAGFTSREKILLEQTYRIRGLDAVMLLVVVYSKHGSNKDSASRVQLLELIERFLFLRTLPEYSRGLVEFDLETAAIAVRVDKLDLRSLVDELQKALSKSIQKIEWNNVLRQWAKGYGAYSWFGIRYFMFEYEQYLKLQTKTKRDKLTWEGFAVDDYEEEFSTIEHVFPQKATDKSWKDAFEKYSVKERNTLRHSIGNLVPLSRAKNSSLRNKPFEEKKGNAEDKVGYSYGCYSENEISHEKEWTAKQILERGIKLLDFMEDRWKLTLGTRKDKIKLLGLDFVVQKTPVRTTNNPK